MKRNKAPWAAESIYRLPRLWSNEELRRLCPHLSGEVVNVSAWRDEDKEGNHYRDYFTSASSYTVTNYVAEARGFQQMPGEIFLDLEQPLPDELTARFDVVFSHTTLEHIYEVHTALANLCAMSRDVVLVVVPFLQPMHGDYGDYWRFTPTALERMFTANGFSRVYSSFNSQRGAAVYILMLASRHPERWQAVANQMDCVCPGGWGSLVGGTAIVQTPVRLLGRLTRRLLRGKKRED